jgi:hypothetical protein
MNASTIGMILCMTMEVLGVVYAIIEGVYRYGN